MGSKNKGKRLKSGAWREIGSLLRPWRGTIALIVLTVFIAEALGVLPSLLLKRIVDVYLIPGIKEGLLLIAIFFLSATAASGVMHFFVTYLTAFVAQYALRDLRVKLFNHLQRLPMGYYDSTPLGEIISRCTADIETVDTLFTSGVANLIARLAQLIAAAAVMIGLSTRLSLVSLVLLPPLIVITRFFQVHIRDAERERRGAIGRMNAYLHETLSGVEVVRAFGQEESFITRFGKTLDETLRAFGKALSYGVFFTPLLTVLVAVSVAFLLWAGTSGLNWGLSMGTLTAFIMLFQRFFEPIRLLGEDWQTVQSAFSGIERIAQVLEIPQENRSLVQTSETPTGRDGPLVEMRGVSFGYVPGNPVLHGITFDVREGEHVAMVGRTGSGKSTVVNLLGGLYAPWSGWIRVAGMDPRGVAEDERRRLIGIVPQTVHLFSGSIRDNLTLNDVSVSPDSIERAAGMTLIDRFVSTLPRGYETLLKGAGRGEGVQLSEGQLQLLSLARALVWAPKVLLLDEATAAVDGNSEAEFHTALQKMMADSQSGAVITVAHRLSTARRADRVIVLEKGCIVEEGNPEELIHRGGNFAALVELEEAGWNWRDG
jgi:ATP-binding cassette subfamily B protein